MRWRRSRDRGGKRREAARDKRTGREAEVSGMRTGQMGQSRRGRDRDREKQQLGVGRGPAARWAKKDTVQVHRKTDGHRDGQTPTQGNEGPRDRKNRAEA